MYVPSAARARYSDDMVTPRPRLLVLMTSVLACLALGGTRSTLAPREMAARTRRPVVLILLENHEYGQIVGNAHAPYINRTFIPRGRLFTRYYAVAHPSLPNYLALTSGSPDGCTSDACPPNVGTLNIFKQLKRNRMTWSGYAASMPRDCARTDSGRYARRHNPAVYYTDIYPKPCTVKDVPYPRKLPKRLADFTFVTPNLCEDMHSCPVSAGDKWLSAHVPGFLKRGAIVVIVFDEGTSGLGGGGHVMCAEVGPGIKAGTKDRTRFDHYGLLAGIERHFGLHRLQRAATHRAVPL
jgi:hypothetical protein